MERVSSPSVALMTIADRVSKREEDPPPPFAVDAARVLTPDEDKEAMGAIEAPVPTELKPPFEKAISGKAYSIYIARSPPIAT